MLSCLQSSSFSEKTFFLLTYINEDSIKPLYFSELGAKILNIPNDTSVEQDISVAMNQEVKKFIKDAILSNDSLCCCVPNLTPTGNESKTWLLHLYAFKQNDSYLIFCNGFTTHNTYNRIVGGVPKRIFEDLIIYNPDHILFGLELDSEFELTLICFGPAIPFLIDYPLPSKYNDKIRLDSLMTASNYCIVKSHALECLNNGGNHNFVYYHETAIKKKYYSIRMVCDLQNDKKRVYGTAIDITDYVNAQHSACPIHQNILKLFDSFNEAACTIHIKGNRSPLIENQTQKFSELLKLNPTFPFRLLTLRMREHLLLNNAPINLKKRLKINEQTTQDFDITITPVFREAKATMLIISALPSSPLLPVHNKVTSTLTPREQQVIKFVLNGEKNIVIACHLNITEGTVKRIISNAYKKLNVSSRTELIKNYLVVM